MERHMGADLQQHTRNEPSAIDLSSVGTLHKPLMSLFVENSAIYVLVELNILLDVPDLLNVLKIPT
jgi:hypothetical protein